MESRLSGLMLIFKQPKLPKQSPTRDLGLLHAPNAIFDSVEPHFVFLMIPRIELFFAYILFIVLICHHCDIWDRAYFNSLLSIIQLTHNPKHFSLTSESYY